MGIHHPDSKHEQARERYHIEAQWYDFSHFVRPNTLFAEASWMALLFQKDGRLVLVVGGGEALGDLAVLPIEARNDQREPRGLARQGVVDPQRRARDREGDVGLGARAGRLERELQ